MSDKYFPVDPCHCTRAIAVSQVGYAISVKASQASALVQALGTVRDTEGDLLDLTSVVVNAIDTAGNLAILTNSTLGSSVVMLTLRKDQRSIEKQLGQINTIVHLAGTFQACLVEVQGVLVQSNVGTAIQTIAGVVSQAASAAITIDAINTLFCDPEVPIPVQVFVATKHTELLANLINAGMYIFTGEPINQA